MKKLTIDRDYIQRILLELLGTLSPTGYTDAVVRLVGSELERLRIPFELTRRGAIRADLRRDDRAPKRAVLGHLDTLGAMVTALKDNGRLAIAPIGTWSSRFAEGAKVTVFAGDIGRTGTILPLKASGHTFNEEVDTQPNTWDNLEVRVDEKLTARKDLVELGFDVGDFVCVEAEPRISNAFITSRHLDDKAGVAAMLAAAKAVQDSDAPLAEGCRMIFTISEETGSGASTVLHGEIAELVAVDNATPAPGQNSSEYGVTVAMMDSSGPFDYHLSRALVDLCRDHGVEHRRDVFRHYRCDAASAVEAGNDIRTALLGFGLDASHGHERVHLDSLEALAQTIALYVQSPLVVQRDSKQLGGLQGFPEQPMEKTDEAV